MSQVLEELKQIITSSDICPEDQNDLLILLPIFPEEPLKKLTQFFQKDPRLVKDFNRTLKARLRALLNGNDEEWERIEKEMKEEKEELEEEKEQEEKDCYYEEKED